MRNSLFNGLTEVCTMVGNMRNIPPVPCMGMPTHYGILCLDTLHRVLSTRFHRNFTKMLLKLNHALSETSGRMT